MKQGQQRQPVAEPGAETTGRRLVFLDVLRAMAILTVLVKHLPAEVGPFFGQLYVWGGRGVDLFFVLSGFLIGSTCLARVASTPEGSSLQQAKAYWLLRSARIFPLYFALLAVLAIHPPGFGDDAAFVIRNWPLPFLTFTSNHFGQSSLELGVLWSLAIEEQFYLAVGLLILMCSSRRETLASAFLGLSLAAIAVSLVYRHDLGVLSGQGLLPQNEYIFRLFHSTLSRMDQLAVGLLASLAAAPFNRWSLARSERWVRASTWSVVAVGLGVLVFFPHQPIVGFLALGLVFAACVLWAQRPAARTVVLRRWESMLLAPVLLIGQLSFGLYLFHPITRPWVDWALTHLPLPPGSSVRAVLFVLVWTGVSTALAALSYRFFEEPLLAAARRKARLFLQPQRVAPTQQAPAAGNTLREAEAETQAV
jgi:peptidoglycan/LPS O-acetylase OafA/YrhL